MLNVEPAETERRVVIFYENLKTAETLQSLDQGSAEYGVTKFSDLTGTSLSVCITLYFNTVSTEKTKLLF